MLKAQRTEAERTRAELANVVDRAKRDLSFTEIRAAFDGVIGNKAVEIGQFVQPGTRLLALVPLEKVWVDANFKETQLPDIKPGQKVDVVVDAFDEHAADFYSHYGFERIPDTYRLVRKINDLAEDVRRR